MTADRYSPDIYVAVLTALPVLWITVGLATEAVRRVVRRVIDARLSLWLPPAGIWPVTLRPHIGPDRMTVEVRIGVPLLPRFTFTTEITQPGANSVSELVVAGALALFMIAGVGGEGVAALALLVRSDNPILEDIAIACLLATVLLTAIVVASSLGALLVDALTPREDGDISNGDPPVGPADV